MKILIVASNMVHVKNFHLPYIEKFKEAGHEVLVMASGEGADFNIPFKKKAFSFKNYRLSFKIRKILKEQRFDAIYLHTTLAAFWTRFAMWGLGRRKPLVINTVHGYLFSKETHGLKTKLYSLAEKLMRRRTDYIVVMNKEDFEIAEKNKLCKKKVFFINGMGVDFSRVSNFQRTERTENLRLTFVGEISKRKNQIFLVKALSKLKNAELTLVGDGDDRENIEKYAKENALERRIKITGFTKDIKKHLENTDIYVSASEIEGLPFNIMEAMRANLPIVASNIKGHSDLLPSECLYTLNDEDAYVELIKKTRLGSENYDTEKYELDGVIDENMRLYLNFLEEDF